jgi:hypothetical protein
MAKLKARGHKGPRRQMLSVVPGSPALTSKTFREPGAGAVSAGTVAEGTALAGATRSRTCMRAVPGVEVWTEARQAHLSSRQSSRRSHGAPMRLDTSAPMPCLDNPKP